jgi:hypothetical protein
MSYRTMENMIRGIMSESHAPALKIPEPERVKDALSLLHSQGLTSAAKQDENTITISAKEAALAADVMNRAIQNGHLQAAPKMVSAEAVPVPEATPDPVEVKKEPHPPEGGQTFGEEVVEDDGHPGILDDSIISAINSATRAVEPREILEYVGLSDSTKFAERVANLAEAGHFMNADGKFTKNTPLVESKTEELETEQNKGSIDAEGKVTLEPRSLNNRMQNKIKKIDEEEVEQIDELSNGTLKKVANVARKKNRPEVLKAAIKAGQRNRNQPDYKFTEEVEQIDEISKKTAGQYLRTGSNTMRAHEDERAHATRDLGDISKNGEKYKGQHKEAAEKLTKATRGIQNRWGGIVNASKKLDGTAKVLAKEEVEQIDELSFGKLASYAKAGTEAVKRSTAIDKKTARRAEYVAKANEKKAVKLSKAAFGEEAKSPVDTVCRILSEAAKMRLLATHNSECGKHCAKVYRDAEWGEHRVKYFYNNKHHEPADSFHGDADDAHDTARAEMKRATKMNGALKEAAEDGTSPFQLNEFVKVGTYTNKSGAKVTLHRLDNDPEHHMVVHDGKVVASHQGTSSDVHKKLIKDGFSGTLHESEQIDELTNHTLGKYITKATKTAAPLLVGTTVHNLGRKIDHDIHYADQVGKKDPRHKIAHDSANKNAHKLKKRAEGISRAVSRLTKEEVEQIDELSPATLTNYAIKAASEKGTHLAKATAKLARSNASRGEPEVKAKLQKDGGDHLRKANNRHDGIKRATSKLVKKPETAGVCEEVLTEGKKDDVEKAKKHLFKLPIANELGNSIHTAARHFNYVQDACDHVYSNHCKDLPYEDYDKIKPHLEATFKEHGLK